MNSNTSHLPFSTIGQSAHYRDTKKETVLFTITLRINEKKIVAYSYNIYSTTAFKCNVRPKAFLAIACCYFSFPSFQFESLKISKQVSSFEYYSKHIFFHVVVLVVHEPQINSRINLALNDCFSVDDSLKNGLRMLAHYLLEKFESPFRGRGSSRYFRNRNTISYYLRYVVCVYCVYCVCGCVRVLIVCVCGYILCTCEVYV